MSDKVNMSLDEIIRASKARPSSSSGGKAPVNKKQGARLSTGRPRPTGRARPTNNMAAKKLVKRAVQRNTAVKRNAGNSGMIPRSQVDSIVNLAVQKAIKQSNANIGIAGRLGGKIPRNIITSSKLAQLNQRSRTIQRNRVAPLVARRGRRIGAQPVQIVQEVVSPQPAVRYIRQPIQAPVVQVVERIVPARQNIRKIGGRTVVARQQQIGRVGAGGRVVRQQVVQRVVQRPVQQQRVVQQRVVQQRPVQRVVQQQQRVIQRPVVQRVIRQAPQVVYQQRPVVQQQRVQVVHRQAPVQQRVQVIRQAAPAPRRNVRQQNVQYVEYTASPSSAARKNNRMRDALGLGNSRQVVRETQRFEPSTSFLANRTVSRVKRGRGFARDF